MRSLSIILIITALTTCCYADIINVPDDLETIQAAIGESTNDDTILVQPGEYVENITFDGKSITLASLFLTTGDEEFIASTVIDGDRAGSVVVIPSGQNAHPQLIGFTIRNGLVDTYGGGILNYSNSTLRNLIVTENTAGNGGGIALNSGLAVLSDMKISSNTATSTGGGIWLTTSNQSFTHLTLINNHADQGGGGFYTGNPALIIEDTQFIGNTSRNGGGVLYNGTHELVLNHCLFFQNVGDNVGGGIHVTRGNTLLNFVTLVDNRSPVGSGVYFERGDSDIISNSIVLNNQDTDIFSNTGELTVSYSDVEGGQDAVGGNLQLNWGDGNIEDDPLFVDQENGDFNLTVNSPCINSGDPESPEDPDGSRADMGALPFSQPDNLGVLQGNVFDLSDHEPLANAQIHLEERLLSLSAVSDTNGFWQIDQVLPRIYSLSIHCDGYLDSTQADIEVDLDDTLEFDIGLLHPEITPSVEQVRQDVPQDTVSEVDFSIENTGDCLLEWSVRRTIQNAPPPFELRSRYGIGELLEDSRVLAVIVHDGEFYIAHAGVDIPQITVMDPEGNIIRSFDQPLEDRRGFQDMTFDGELIWGAIGDTVYGLTLDGEMVQAFRIQYNPTLGIAYDPVHEYLWVSSTTTNPVAYTRNGELVENSEIDRQDLRLYGLAWFSDDADGAQLYMFNNDRETDQPQLHKANVETGEISFVATLANEFEGSPKGCQITDELDPLHWVLVNLSRSSPADGGDLLEVRQLAAKVNWMNIEPREGVLLPAQVQNFHLTLDATGLDQIHFPGELIFTRDNVGGEVSVPIDMIVVDPASVQDEAEIIPAEFAIESTYPNPFNSSTTISYNLPVGGSISLKIYNTRGQLVDVLKDGVMPTGRHSLRWDADRLSAGVYFAMLTERNGGMKNIMKIAHMK